MLMNEMAISDKYESLTEAGAIDPPIIDHYASYSSAALDGIGKYGQLSKAEQTPDAAIFFMSEAIAAVDGIVPVTKQHIRYAKAARHAIQTYQKRPAKGGDK
jgi:hypothetical protein